MSEAQDRIPFQAIRLPPFDLNRFTDPEFAHGILNVLCWAPLADNSYVEGVLRIDTRMNKYTAFIDEAKIARLRQMAINRNVPAILIVFGLSISIAIAMISEPPHSMRFYASLATSASAIFIGIALLQLIKHRTSLILSPRVEIPDKIVLALRLGENRNSLREDAIDTALGKAGEIGEGLAGSLLSFGGMVFAEMRKESESARLSFWARSGRFRAIEILYDYHFQLTGKRPEPSAP